MRIHWPQILPALLVAFLAACSQQEEKAVVAPVPVQVAHAVAGPIHRIITADGVLWPLNQASVVPKISAPVRRFLVQRGDHVQRGALLAVLENRDLAAAKTESSGQLAAAEANYRSTAAATVPEQVTKAETDVTAAQQAADAARTLLDSREKLFQQGAMARKLVDEARVAWAQANSNLVTAKEHLRALQSVGKQEQVKGAQAQVEAAQGHLQSAEANLGYSEIRSPIAGIISDRPLWEGEMASVGMPLLTVMDISSVIARVNVPQSQIGYIHIGDPATLSTDSGEHGEGKVMVVSPATDPASTTLQVWIQAPNPGERLKPGTSVHAAMVVGSVPNAVIVSTVALLPSSEPGVTAVLVVAPDNVAHLKPVQIGIREPDKVQILSGVSPGEQVVVEGGVGVENGAKVQIVVPGEKAKEEKQEAKKEK